MIFNQFGFLFLFLPATLVLVFLPGLRPFRTWMLAGASLAFYGFSGFEHVLILAAGIVWVYLLMAGESAIGSRWRLVLAIIVPALALTYYKYSGFLISQVLPAGGDGSKTAFSLFENVLLPAGISFFTFQLISFAIDRYRGTLDAAPSLGQFALYISFFPQLVAGPIVRFSQVSEAIVGLAEWRPGRRDVEVALGYTVMGLASKVLIADTLAHYLAPLVADPGALTAAGAAYVLVGYSFQIYFDFYGYSLIAIGLGYLFGFRLPRNFLRPYESRNPKDFWRRWHMTLSYWIRDYLYLPLGGNRRYHVNIAIVFALCGLWHGAGWNFVVWGLFHAGLVLGYSLTSRVWDPLPALFQVGLTFVLVSLGWTLFLFDFTGAGEFYRSLAGLGTGEAHAGTVEMWVALAVAAGVCFGLRFEEIALRAERDGIGRAVYGAGLALTLGATMLFVDRSETFIYFRF